MTNNQELLSALILALAASLDYSVADPKNLIHPVQVMGWFIAQGTKLTSRFCQKPWQLRLAGMGLGIGLIFGSGGISWLVIRGARQLHPFLAVVIQTILLSSCFAGRSLRLAALDVLGPLSQGDLLRSRRNLSQYVGRDTDDLSTQEVLRALVETVAENTTDGVTGPLFYAIVGSFVTIIGSVPLALAYKAASTLDSMVGYQREPYTHLGWFSAKFEDYLTWLPCRLTVLSLAILSGQPSYVWRVSRQDGSRDPSPNSGWSEAAFAAVLEVQLGGKNYYGSVPKEKPLLGEPHQPLSPAKVMQALFLTRSCFLVWLGLAIVAHLAVFL